MKEQYNFDLSDVEGKYHLKYIKNTFDPIPGTQLKRERKYNEDKRKLFSKLPDDFTNKGESLSTSVKDGDDDNVDKSNYKFQFAMFQTDKLIEERVSKPISNIREKFHIAADLINQDETKIFNKYSLPLVHLSDRPTTSNFISSNSVYISSRPMTSGDLKGKSLSQDGLIHSNQTNSVTCCSSHVQSQVGFTKRKTHHLNELSAAIIQHLEQSIKENNLYEIEKLVLKYPRTAHYRSDDSIQHTLIHICVLNGYIPLMKLLLRLGLNPNVVNDTGDHPSHLCVGTWGVALTFARARTRRPRYVNDMEQKLIDDANEKLNNAKASKVISKVMSNDSLSESSQDLVSVTSTVILSRPPAVIPAMTMSEKEIIDLLFELLMILFQHGALVDIQDFQGNTCLHLACRYDMPPKIIQLLMNFHCDTSIKNKFGHTPVDILHNSNTNDTGSWASSSRKVVRLEIMKMITNATTIAKYSKIDEFSRHWRMQRQVSKEQDKKQRMDELMAVKRHHELLALQQQQKDDSIQRQIEVATGKMTITTKNVHSENKQPITENAFSAQDTRGKLTGDGNKLKCGNPEQLNLEGPSSAITNASASSSSSSSSSASSSKSLKKFLPPSLEASTGPRSISSLVASLNSGHSYSFHRQAILHSIGKASERPLLDDDSLSILTCEDTDADVIDDQQLAISTILSKKQIESIRHRRILKAQNMCATVRAATANVSDEQRKSRYQLSDTVILSSVSRTAVSSGSRAAATYAASGFSKGDTYNRVLSDNLFAVRPMSHYNANRPIQCASDELGYLVADARQVKGFETFKSFWTHSEQLHRLADKQTERKQKLTNLKQQQIDANRVRSEHKLHHKGLQNSGLSVTTMSSSLLSTDSLDYQSVNNLSVDKLIKEESKYTALESPWG